MRTCPSRKEPYRARRSLRVTRGMPSDLEHDIHVQWSSACSGAMYRTMRVKSLGTCVLEYEFDLLLGARDQPTEPRGHS